MEQRCQIVYQAMNSQMDSACSKSTVGSTYPNATSLPEASLALPQFPLLPLQGKHQCPHRAG